MAHPAEIYNRAKNQTFAIYNRDGEAEAYKYLNSQFGNLSVSSWYGLKAELDFYTKYKDKYILDPTLDMGIKCDFTGDIDGATHCRIDVTTNVNFKHLEDYEPIQNRDHRKYKIAVMDKDTGELVDVVDLNFPYDGHGGRKLDIAVFMPQDYNDEGDARYNYYQRIVSVGTTDPSEYAVEKDTLTDWLFPDIHTYLQDLVEAEVSEPQNELQKYLADAAKFLSKVSGYNIVACAQARHIYNQITDDDDEVVTQIYWKHPIIKNKLDDIINSEI